ncbi:glycosyltransferase family 2 protein [Sphingomonas crusticola]|uniref:glycosyltransferase family 2 protein n=1 Tax=Sphingomonas crusticola TaxID=1697973 RepID=UPI000E224596|nr:glycosyltransferase family 2 protein [Sphingomonas crusticola]
MSNVATVILTYNEEMHIARAIDSAKAFSSDILVVDSFSTDRTVDIARSSGARVLQNKFINHSRQFAWGLENGDIRAEWTLRLDADEIIGADLAQRIRNELPNLPSDVAGVTFSRRHIFMGRWVRHGGRYPLHLLRLWRTGQGAVEDRWMDEHVVLTGGRAIQFEGFFADASLRDLSSFIAKHNRYATLEAVEVLNQRHNLFERARDANLHNSGRQMKMKRLIKERIYNKLPFAIGPLAYFLFRYLIQLGFLDGREGLIYHFMQGLWYRLLVEAKTDELEPRIAACKSRDERIALLIDATGLNLTME